MTENNNSSACRDHKFCEMSQASQNEKFTKAENNDSSAFRDHKMLKVTSDPKSQATPLP